MSIDETVQNAAIEAKKYGLRQSKEGVILSFVLHPDDVTNAVLLAPVGQRGMLVFVPINDDEQIEPNMVRDTADFPPVCSAAMDEAKESADRPINPDRSERSKRAYAQANEGEKAVTRAALLAQDTQFQTWLKVYDEEQAARYIRSFCGVSSRKDMAKNASALHRFFALEERYRMSSGQMTDARI